jgi:hypothetical protein
VLHAVIYRAQKQIHSFWFALSCLFAAFYDLASAGLYSVSDFENGIFWQQFQFSVIALLAISFIWYIWTFLRFRKNIIPIIFTVIFSLIFLITAFYSGPHMLSAEGGGTKIIGITSSMNLEIYEGLPGIVTYVELIMLFCSLLFFFLYALLNPGATFQNKTHRTIFLLAFLVFTISGINDIFVILRVYKFTYTFEYSYLVIIMFMSFIHIDAHLKLLKKTELDNTSLEEGIKQKWTQNYGHIFK